MMTEVVDDCYASGDTLHLHTTLNPLERIKGRLDLLVLQPAMFWTETIRFLFISLSILKVVTSYALSTGSRIAEGCSGS